MLLSFFKNHRLLRRNPGFFDAGFYTAQLKGIGRFFAVLSPQAHYLLSGWKRGLNPHPFFDTEHYLFAYPDVAASGADPLIHYIVSGAAEARRPNPLLKPDHYILTNNVSLQEALAHYTKTSSDETRGFHTHKKLRLRGPVKRIDDYTTETGQRLIELPSPRTHDWTSPIIINRDIPITRIEATLPKQYVAVLNNITAFPGTKLLLSADNQILHDELADDPANDYLDKLKAIGNYTNGVCTISAAYIGMRLERALLISSDTDFNYFHMLIETLPKLRLAEEAGCPADVPILMQGDLHPNLVTALERAAKGRKIVYAPWGSAIEVDELWFASDLSRILNTAKKAIDPAYDMVICPDAVRYISQRILGGRAPPQGRRKLYMSRTSSYRHLANQDEFMAMLAAQGFEIIDTGRMTLDEQIAAMAGAYMMIAPTGAALTNLLWCPEDCRVLVLVSDHPNLNLNVFNQIGEILGSHVEFCLGNRIHDMNDTYSFHDSFEADLDVIATWCDRHNAAAA